GADPSAHLVCQNVFGSPSIAFVAGACSPTVSSLDTSWTDSRDRSIGFASGRRSDSTSSVVETSRSPWRAVNTRSPAYVDAGTGTYPVMVPTASARTVKRTAPSTTPSTWPGASPVRAYGSQRPAAARPPSPRDAVGSRGSTVASGGSGCAGSVSTATGPRS